MANTLIRKVEDPFEREMVSLRDAMDRLVSGSFINPMRMFSTWGEGFGADMPPIDLVEDTNQYTIKAALPGWQPKDVDVTYEHGTVTISGQVGEVKEETEEKDKKYHRKEIIQKSFARTLSLPSDVNADKAIADFEGGMLTLTLPKSEVVKPKQIKITSKEVNK